MLQMSNTYILIPDLDDKIILHLSPTSVLRLSAVNKHYRHILSQRRFEFTEVKFDVCKALEKNYVWIVYYAFKAHDMIKLLDLNAVSKFTFNSSHKNPLIYAYQHYNQYIIQWLLDYFTDRPHNYIVPDMLISVIYHMCELSNVRGLDMVMTECDIRGINIPDYVYNRSFVSIKFANKEDIETAKYLIDRSKKMGKNIDICRQDHLGYTAFMLATKSNNIEAVKWLFELDEKSNIKYDIHKYDEYMFRTACDNSNFLLAKFLIDLGERSYGKIDIHRQSIDNYGSVQFPLKSICMSGDVDFLKWFIELGEKSYGKVNIHIYNDTAFIVACQKGYVAIIRMLIELGESTYGKIDIHGRNEYAFVIACENNHCEIIQYLFDLGDSYGKIDLSADNYAGFRAALHRNNTKVIHMLLEKGIDTSKINFCK